MKKGKQHKSIVIAGGGTGGHLFPGITIAREFVDREPGNRVLFISTGNEIEKKALARAGFPLRTIRAAGIKGRGLWNQIKSMFIIPVGIIQAVFLMKAFQPDLVIGMGSYSAGPVVMGAFLMRIGIVLHEQNILPGITNRILSYFAKRIYISFEDTRSNFNLRKLRITGNPVGRDLLDLKSRRPGEHNRFSILVLGGSQGAHNLNLSVLECLNELEEKDKYFFIHQTGEKDERTVREAFDKSGVNGDIRPFFSDMAGQYERTDMMICRSGATTVAEITATGKPAIFVPFPFAADNHQVLNARSLSDKGAAETILEKDLDGKLLADRIEYYRTHPTALKQMAERAKALGKPRAAAHIVDDIYNLFETRN